ncbi:mitofilin family membrane protein [Allorhizobium pseudoryzae]|uniref:COG4223 family protein n=1 Tax=Allorhizobium pseudoryzae TaxID=379684 RepID=UPI003D04D508
MVSDKPPRRSRSGKTPVTIDLEAEAVRKDEASPVAEPVRSNDTDAPKPAVTPEETPVSAAPETADGTTTPSPASAAEAQTETPDFAAQTAVEQASGEPPPAEKAAEAQVDAPTDAQKTDTLKSEDVAPFASTATAPETPQPERPQDETEATARPAAEAPAARPPAADTVKGTRTSAMVASGILGGLVALLLAGSMQYAGYLPGLSQQPSAATRTELDEIRQQMDALRVSSATAPAGGEDLEQRLQALESAIGQAGQNGQSELEQRLATLQADLDALKTAGQAEAESASQLGQRLNTLESRVNQPGREQAVARALAAAALKAATERGGSFAAELQTYGQVAKDDPAVAELQAYAEKGVPTRAELTRRLQPAANAILDAVHQPTAGESITDRLLSSAMRVVKVRPVGEVEGETPEAILARMEERVKNGDLKAAVAEWNTLPDAAKQASSDFKAALDARIAVEDLMNATLTRAMASAGTNG